MVELVDSHGGRSEAGWWDRIRPHSLGWVTARVERGDEPRGRSPRTGDSPLPEPGERHGLLVGFVNVATDGGDHAFLIDTKTRGAFQRRGVATRIVAFAAEHAKAAGCEWLHVDFDEPLRAFYFDACGFEPTPAGLIHLPSLQRAGGASAM
jgi:GNAT superfamily N-acetyltransferase